MPVKHRSRIDITAQILQSANGRQVTKTRMLYDAFLSYAQLKEYLVYLVGKGLLEYQKETGKYRTTEKGIRFLKMYEKMDKIVPGIRLPEVK